MWGTESTFKLDSWEEPCPSGYRNIVENSWYPNKYILKYVYYIYTHKFKRFVYNDSKKEERKL